jgi:Fe2+ or Zn2+ uptake regulation protein
MEKSAFKHQSYGNTFALTESLYILSSNDENDETGNRNHNHVICIKCGQAIHYTNKCPTQIKNAESVNTFQ